jgi:hypothetical protein
MSEPVDPRCKIDMFQQHPRKITHALVELCRSVSLGGSNAVGRRKVVILPKVLHTVKNIVPRDSASVTESVRGINDFVFHPSFTNILG